ncbi:hypothetical protein KCV07_g498, partial [Aureobasidium melanogenum]
MEQFWCCQCCIALSSQSDKVFLSEAISEMLVPFPVVTDAHERHRFLALFGEIVMTRPDPDVFWQAQELTSRVEEVIRTTTRKINAIRCLRRNPIWSGVWPGRCRAVTLFKYALVFLCRDLISLAEQLLHLHDAFADTDEGLMLYDLHEREIESAVWCLEQTPYHFRTVDDVGLVESEHDFRPRTNLVLGLKLFLSSLLLGKPSLQFSRSYYTPTTSTFTSSPPYPVTRAVQAETRNMPPPRKVTFTWKISFQESSFHSGSSMGPNDGVVGGSNGATRLQSGSPFGLNCKCPASFEEACGSPYSSRLESLGSPKNNVSKLPSPD